MKNKFRKIINIILTGMIFFLVLIVIASVFKIRSIHNKRVEEANAKKDEHVEEQTEPIKDIEPDDYINELVAAYEETVSDGFLNQLGEQDTYLLNYEPLILENIPEYSGEPYIEINEGIPEFYEEQLSVPAFEYYSPLDWLGRCGVATANVSIELMPTEERGNIGQIKPSGWHTVKYPDLIADRYLYNRCHLIAYSICGENDNECNLITGTRYMNVTGMLPFENEVSGYVKRTGNHVLYRVTPCFYENELVARGVHMEAFSVEDNGAGVCYNVYVYNVQPGITIDYSTGDSWITKEE